ncbi:DUF4240 domain-containing protein [Streptomyces sp. NBC_01007]|nr:DUF4240 domain-containing protein [Streptomyces sp. NBC_01007]WRZ95731.1 DUF4240 domain-containing protein [Streptomyces sp. NBC_01007]
MNREQFWQLIEAARNQASNPNDAEAVARRAASQLATHPAEEIVAAQQVLWDLMADSYTNRRGGRCPPPPSPGPPRHGGHSGDGRSTAGTRRHARSPLRALGNEPCHRGLDPRRA